MAEVRYPFTKPQRDEAALHAEIAVLGLPGFLGVFGSEGMVAAAFSDPLSTADRTRLADAVAAHAGTKRKPKALPPLTAELLAFVAVPAGQPAWMQRLVKVAAMAAAAALLRDPTLARRLGEAIDGDEPA